MGPVTTVKYRNYTKEGNPSWGSNDPPGCLDSWRVSTLCSRERSRRKARFKAGVNFNRYSSARQKKRRHGKRGVRGLKRWLKRMKTLVAAVGRYVALFSREPQINTPPPTPVTPSACHVPSRFLRRPFFLPPPLPSTDGTRSNRWKDRIAARAAGHFSTGTYLLAYKEFDERVLWGRVSLEWEDVCYPINWEIISSIAFVQRGNKGGWL